MDSSPPSRVLVTGATGYIGSAFLERSRLKSRLVPLSGRIPEVSPAMVIQGMDAVVHLAAVIPTGIEGEQERKIVNEDWTLALAQACAAQGTPLLFASTSGVYASHDGSLLSEETSAIAPQTPYAESKYRMEHALKSLQDKNLHFSVLRFGSVFGSSPRMHYRTINAYVRQALSSQPIEIWKQGVAGRKPYTYIGDCIEAIDVLLEKNIFEGEVYNCVSENLTTEEVIALVLEAFPEADITYVESPRMNDFSYGMDDSKLRKLGFKAQGTVKAGIAELGTLAGRHSV